MSEFNSIKCNSIEKTNYQRNRDKILNRAKNLMKITKKYQKSKQKINTKIYQKKEIIKRENMEEIYIVICLKKRNKN